eukprot:Anaeramoba_ignava/a218120_277.p1 GENE.a218120_277~~a218120_277.p1  ORF type:complete len:179 (+),score=51.49 a218120_277:67-603(+)
MSCCFDIDSVTTQLLTTDVYTSLITPSLSRIEIGTISMVEKELEMNLTKKMETNYITINQEETFKQCIETSRKKLDEKVGQKMSQDEELFTNPIKGNISQSRRLNGRTRIDLPQNPNQQPTFNYSDHFHSSNEVETFDSVENSHPKNKRRNKKKRKSDQLDENQSQSQNQSQKLKVKS